MVIKITTFIYAEVADHDEGQELCNALSLGLENRIDGLPVGEMVGVSVDTYSAPTDEELVDAGMVE